jgi:hypothetical protein
MLYAHCLDVVNVGYLMCRRYFIGPGDSLLKYSTAHLKAERHIFTIQFGIFFFDENRHPLVYIRAVPRGKIYCEAHVMPHLHRTSYDVDPP